MASIEWLEQTASTNSTMSANADRYGHGAVIAARSQTAGRGQRGNHWESEPGSNLTFSMMLRPTVIEAARQFELSMLVSLGICDALTATTGLDFRIKWPNDIYHKDLKVCGILIENVLDGHNIARSIVGIGINVNQKRFLSDAPNPASLKMLTGMDYELGTLLEAICHSILNRFDCYEKDADAKALVLEYHRRLWRRIGIHTWLDTDTRESFDASISAVDLDGTLSLKLNDGSIRRYAFKEVSPIMNTAQYSGAC